MVKNGKSRKPKKNQSADSSAPLPAPPPPAPAPRRVTNSINIPVRHQIMMAQLNKEMQRASSPSFRQKRVVRTSYRREMREEEALEKAEERRRRGQDPDWDVILSRNATRPLVIVDGYNIIHRWSRLKKHMLKGDPARARQLLVDDLENLASLKGWRIEVVFDGAGRRSFSTTAASSSSSYSSSAASDGASLFLAQGPTAATPRAEQESRREVSKHGVRVVFTGASVEADTYIESRCAAAKDATSGRITGSFIVATDDQMIRLAGANAGALCMGADRFVTELKAVKQSVSYRVEAAVAAANGRAILPEKLRGTAMADRRFGRGSVLIEDKRKLREEAKQRRHKGGEVPDIDVNIEVEADENGIPWWAKVPNRTRTH